MLSTAPCKTTPSSYTQTTFAQEILILMNPTKKILVILAAAACLLTGANAADAARTYPEGGTWDSGRNFWTGTVYSNYHHPTRMHGSTACNANSCNRSSLVVPGRWSYASIKDTTGGNASYYRFN